MTTLVSLVGEQPIPVLLPALHLKPATHLLVHTATTEATAQRLKAVLPVPTHLIPIPAYEFGPAMDALKHATASEDELIFNISGGTKIMSLAAFMVAQVRRAETVYLESEKALSRLWRYAYDASGRIVTKHEELGALLTLDLYLKAHLAGYREEGPHRDDHGIVSEGGRFEQVLRDTLAVDHNLEVLCGVRPFSGGQQVEMDLLVRLGNQVGVAEVKVGAQGEHLKAGMDQLIMATSREYLGTYTVRFLIVGREVTNRWQRDLALERKIQFIELPEYKDGQPLPAQVARRLVQAVRARLGGTP
jgi:hypothetical protein